VDTSINEWWNNIWGASVVLTAPLGSECDFNPGDEYNNYGFTVAGSDLTVSYCAGSCDATCGGADPCADVTCGDGQTCEDGICIDGGDDTGVVFSGGFGGAVVDGNTYTNPTGVEPWAGFANEDVSLYPFSFPDGGEITFTGATAETDVDVYFRFEYNPYPDTEPSFNTAAVTVSGTAEASYSLDIPAQGANTYSSFLLYVATADAPVTLTDVTVTSDNGGGDDSDWMLVWSDEFDETDIDMTKWSYEVGTGNWGWGNGEAQYYTDNSNNSFIEDGKLIIKAIRQSYSGSDYTSARMVTKNKGDWTYGRIEVRAKLPAGTGTWPAIWMMPTDSEYGGWPDSGEIDIMEHVGFDPGAIHATAHNDTYNWYDGIPPSGGTLNINDFDENFHTYTLEWTEGSLRWFVDETLYYTYSNNSQGWSTWPYDHDFFMILNIAIGGTWGGQQGIDDSIFPVQMEVEYVRVYQVGSDCVTLGDVNNDNELNVLDIVTIVNLILSDETSDPCSDYNQDGSTNILDLVSLVSTILEN